MKILVTGHKGYIGNHLHMGLTNLGYEVEGVDLKDGKDIFSDLPDEDFDFVFHLAAFPSVNFSVKNPCYTLKQNVLGTSVLLEWAKDHGVQRFIFSSSAAINGDGDGPKSPYGLHKLMSEMECKLYSELYGLDTICLRYSNVYSEDQRYRESDFAVITSWVKMIHAKKPLKINGDGKQTRDFIHVNDIVSANIFLMQDKLNNPKNFMNAKVFEVGSGKSISLNYIKELIDGFYNNIEWMSVLPRKGDVRHATADISELRRLGWAPKITIEQGLKKCFKNG